MNKTDPSTTAVNGRLEDGRFGPGNKLSRGNPHARRVAELRSAMLKAVSNEDLRMVIDSILKQAKAGDVASAKVLLERVLGPPEAADLMERLDVLEQRLVEFVQRRAGMGGRN
jgi:hypothetical protein